MLPLVWRASEHQRLLFPDAAAGEVEACIGKSPAEVQTFGVRMEHIDGSIAGHDGLHIGESVEQELIECVVCHVVVLNLPSRAFIVHIVRRVRDHEVGLDVAHQSIVGFLLCGIAANQTVPTERPNVASLGEGGLFQLLIHIEIIVVNAVLQAALEKVVNLGRVKTGEGNIKVLALQVSDQQGQLVLIPITADLVQGDVESLLLGFVHFNDHTVNLCDAKVDEDLEPLVPTDNTTGRLIPDDRFDITELLDGAFQFFIFLVTGLQVLARVVFGRKQLCRFLFLNQHIRPHSANLSKPPMRSMKALAVSTILSYGMPFTASSPMAQTSSTGAPVSCALSHA